MLLFRCLEVVLELRGAGEAGRVPGSWLEALIKVRRSHNCGSPVAGVEHGRLQLHVDQDHLLALVVDSVGLENISLQLRLATHGILVG